MTAPPAPTGPTPLSPELLYLLSGDEDFEAACAEFLPADIAEGLNGLPLDAAIKVATALPFNRAVQVFDEPQLQRRGELVGGMETARAAPLIEALSADQQVELFRELSDEARARLIHLLVIQGSEGRITPIFVLESQAQRLTGSFVSKGNCSAVEVA